MAKDLTKDFSGKSPAETASIMKAEAGGVKRVAELRIWPEIDKARDREDKLTATYWLEVIHHLAYGTEDPTVPTVDSFGVASSSAKPELTLT